jgi:class 3 adenylate cyclase
LAGECLGIEWLVLSRNFLIAVGEPVVDSNDLFGTTVQMAARLCQAAEPESILISKAVRDGIHGRFGSRELARAI